jgi:hypothetical protein
LLHNVSDFREVAVVSVRTRGTWRARLSQRHYELAGAVGRGRLARGGRGRSSLTGGGRVRRWQGGGCRWGRRRRTAACASGDNHCREHERRPLHDTRSQRRDQKIALNLGSGGTRQVWRSNA